MRIRFGRCPWLPQISFRRKESWRYTDGMPTSETQTRIVRLVLLTGWGVLLIGLLNAEPVVARLIDSNHDICGLWGCGPPVSALIVWHSFIAAIGIPAVVGLAIAKPQWAQTSGRWMLGLTLLLIGLFVLINTGLWYESASSAARQFLVRRVLFATVAFVDAPVLPLIATAVVWWQMGRRRSATNANFRSDVQQLEHLGDITVRQVDAAS